jgi:two-component system, chemotaxis family, chemotaxis protein CheY
MMVVLIVDDSAAMRRIEQKALESAGWTVAMAATGEDALAHLRTMPSCDLLLTDWHMPGMGGLALVRALRDDPRYQKLRILVVTSESVLNALAQAMEAGANDIVMKPFTREALLERITAVMEGVGQ